MSKKDHHAIVIGIATYPDPSIKSLEGPVRDANAFYNWLRDKDGGDVDTKNIKRLLTTDFHPPGPDGPQDAHPVASEIHNLFASIVELGCQGRFGQRLYIYASGHGLNHPHDANSVGLCAANAQDGSAYSVMLTEYAEWFRRHVVFDEIVLVMDCCRTIHDVRMVAESRLPLHVTSFGPRIGKVRCFFAYAVGTGQVAREKKLNGGPTRGIFTAALMEALRQAAPDESGWVKGSAIADYIHTIYERVAGNTPVEPPNIPIDRARDLNFFRRGAAVTQPVEILVDAYTSHETLVFYDDTLQIIRRRQAVDPSVTIDLEPGLYKVGIANTARERRFEVPSHVPITL